jgi:hypothetical protein
MLVYFSELGTYIWENNDVKYLMNCWSAYHTSSLVSFKYVCFLNQTYKVLDAIILIFDYSISIIKDSHRLAINFSHFTDLRCTYRNLGYWMKHLKSRTVLRSCFENNVRNVSWSIDTRYLPNLATYYLG